MKIYIASNRNRMTPAENILEILSSRRALPPGRKGIYSEDLADLVDVDEEQLGREIQRARKRCPRGKTIRAYREKWGTVWHLVCDYNAVELQGELFERRVA